MLCVKGKVIYLRFLCLERQRLHCLRRENSGHSFSLFKGRACHVKERKLK